MPSPTRCSSLDFSLCPGCACETKYSYGCHPRCSRATALSFLPPLVLWPVARSIRWIYPLTSVLCLTTCSYGRCSRATALSLRLPIVLWQASARPIRADPLALAPSRAVPSAGCHRHSPPTTAPFLSPPPLVPVPRARIECPYFPHGSQICAATAARKRLLIP